MFRVPLVTNDQDILLENFWTALLIYHDRPHLVNRRLTGASQVLFMEVFFENRSIKRIMELLTYPALIYEIRKLKQITKENITSDLIKSILLPYDNECELEDSSVENMLKSECGTFVSVRILLPRNSVYKNSIEIAVFDKNENLNVATFFAITEKDDKPVAPPFPYDIEYLPPGIVNICVDNIEYAETSNADWLVCNLFPKLMKWAADSTFNSNLKTSLSLVNIEFYNNLYHTLKEKYGKYFIKIWPENTDPHKFVYEDIAIAAYLIALWEKRSPFYKPSFIDLGCGNGLLVHILNQEGFPGYGLDVRKRKIWDLYPASTILKVQTIIPSENSLFSDADWIIGNHSDELTPWIPVITARSSYKANFFLLPCCSYEFDGNKYQRKNTAKSQYSDYLDYIEDICKTCGFVTIRDKLRIPSTKRICLVSEKRSYNTKNFSIVDENISELLRLKVQIFVKNNSSDAWIENFTPRSDKEQVRNCSKLNKNVINAILKQISKILLKENNFVIKADGKTWNKGKSENISDLAKSIRQEDLKELKKECGGLQTLLKNHRYLFHIENGLVQFRIPPAYDRNNGKHKSKQCWFYDNHPDGCFYDDDSCSYKH